jgi:hypothetical protein
VILQRALWLIAAAAALAAAAAIFVIALAFGFYALLEPYLGRAGAAGALALLCAAAIGVAGLIAAAKARGPRIARSEREADREAFNLTERLFDLIRAKPFAAAGVAAAVGLIAIRNPRMIGAILAAFLQGWQGAGDGKKR